MVAVSRRAGKTYTATYCAIQSLLKGEKVLWLAPYIRQIVDIYASIKKTCLQLILSKKANETIELITGGTISFQVTSNPDAIRSKGYDLIVWDEMAHSDHLNTIWTAMFPTLAQSTTSRFLGISTPNGLNAWYDKWVELKQSNPDDWAFTIKDWTCSPHLIPSEIEKIKRSMSEGEFKQEMCACFLQIKGSMFPSEWFKDIYIDQMPPYDTIQRHCISIDLSLGRLHSDWQAVVYVAVIDGTLYVDCQCKLMPVEELVQFVKTMNDYYKPEFTAWETNGFQILAVEAYHKLFTVPPRVILVDNKVKKETRIERLGYLLEKGKVKILRNPGGNEMLKELVNFPNPTRDRDIHDDALDALEQGWRALAET